MKGANVAVHATRHATPTPKFRLVGEFLRLGYLARYRFSNGARPWLGIATALTSALVAVLLHFHVLRPELWRSGDVYAALPLSSELARLPMSLFLPTTYLPLWAACAQLLVVIGLGELILGRWLTIVVASVGHVGSTLLARVLLESVHGHVFGMTTALAHVLDTGPSAATTAVGACLLVTVRMNRCVLLLSAGLIAAALVAPGVDGVEHTSALAWGVTAGVLNYAVLARFSASHDWHGTRRIGVRVASVMRGLGSLRLTWASLHHGDRRHIT
jgi:hypothetical protein